MTVVRRAVRVVLTAVAIAVLPAAAAPATAAPVATLAPGEHVFWDGPFVQRATVGAGDLCGVAGPCWTYSLVVGQGDATRLRVALDWATSWNMYALELFDPAGKLAGTMSGYGTWNDELFVSRPRPGTWTVRVVPEDVTASSFRARAKLEAPPRPAPVATPFKKAAKKKATRRKARPCKRTKRRSAAACRKARSKRRGAKPPARSRATHRALPDGVVLPNLQVNAPWDATLVGPIAVGPTALVIHRPNDVLGFHPLSCSADEMLLNGVQRCLRFSVGPMNIAPGPFELEMDLQTARPNGEGHLEGDVKQRLYRRDGTFEAVDAGSFVAHEQHAHFHAQDLLQYQLLRVTDLQRGTLELAGAGNKASFCTLDLMIPFFDEFATEAPKFRGPSPCAVPPEGDTKLVMGISPGWADVYTWDLPDQYVDFAAGGEGHFVIQATVDPANTVIESDDTDNHGYALVRITGDRIEQLERGLGRSPWDPRKRVLPQAP